MTLKPFLEKFVRKGSLIRLWVRDKQTGGHTMIISPNNKKVWSEWDVRNGNWPSLFADKPVLYLADILCDSYPEAINIVINLEGEK